MSSSRAAHHILESITFSGGYLASAQLDFADGLNCLIGGRGAGKTTVLEVVRYVLGAPVPPSRAAAHEAIVKGTLKDGIATVHVRTQHGVRYTVSRAYGDAPRVRSAEGDVQDVSLDGELFKLDVYGQNEIESIATSPAAQLALVDRFVEPMARKLGEAIGHAERLLAQGAAELFRLERDVFIAR